MTRFKIWSSCRLLGLLVLSFVHPETVQMKPTITHDRPAVMPPQCIFWGNPTEACVKTTGYVLPNRFLQIYESMNEEMKESIRTGRLETMAPEDFAKLPTSLFLLIPSYHLKSVSGSALALLVATSQDVAVAVKVMDNFNIDMFEDFFTKLQGVELASQIQDIIAKTLVKLLPDVNNWTFPRFRVIEKVGNPLLARLPSYFLANLTKLEASKFLFHLRNWLWSNLPTHMWYGKTKASKRAWTDLMLRSAYPYNVSEWSGNEVRRFRYFLEGATPDELKQLTAQQLQNTKMLRTKLSRLQAQALFSILYSNRELSSANLTDAQLLPVAVQLSPANLLGFNVSQTDFRVLKPLFEQRKASYATAKQVLESLIAQSVLLGRLKSVESETWGNGIEHLGKFIYVLPASALESYKLSPPTALVQSSIDSDRITAKQARLLTGGNILNLEKPDLIMGQKGLLRALSSSQLVSVRTLPQNILYHLLVNLPSGMPVQSAALLQKMKRLLGDRWTLEKILSNTHPNQFFEMLPSRTVAAIVANMKKVRGFDKVIKGLPQNTLSVLLTATRKSLPNLNGTWTSDNLLSGDSNLALLGLTCNDIYAVETIDLIPIMEHYNRVRQALNKPFLKDLQYCCQMALMKYLEIKASLLGFKHSKQLLDYLEPAEIEAIGGYILATLPIEEVKRATNSQYILEAIGQLSLPELLVATKEIKPYNYARLLLEKHVHSHQSVTEIKSSELASFGHLIYFLPAIDIMKINPVSFKLFVESVDDSTSKVVCADSSRRLAWYQIILKAFGKPFRWTSSTLATLGDLLLVLPSHQLNSIPVDSWTDAADTLTEETSYHIKVEWPGMVDQIQLYQACAEVLEDSESSKYIAAVRELARWYLAAVQSQLNAVVTASELLAAVYQSQKGEPERKMIIPNFPMEVQYPDTIVKVLEPDEIQRPLRVKKPGAEMEFGTDQDGKTTVKVITSDIFTGIKNIFHTTPKPQTVSTILASGSTTVAQQTEAVYNNKTFASTDVTSLESTESPVIISAAKGTESVASVMPDEITHAPATLQAVTAVLSDTNKTWNISLIQDLEEMVAPTTLHTEVHTHSPVHISTAAESGSWSDIQSHAINNNEDDTYLTSLKVVRERTISLEGSLKGTALTETNSTASTTVVSNSKPIPSDINSAEGNTEQSGVLPNKFAEQFENKTLPQKLKLESSAASSQVHGHASLQMDAEMSLSSNTSKYENVKVRRHAKTEESKEQKSNWTTSGSSQSEKSGEILRGVIRTNSLTWQTKPPSGSTLSAKTEITSVQPSERKQTTTYWQRVEVSCDAIRAAGQSAGLALDETGIELMGHEELEMCVDTLGSLELDNKVQRKIWSLVNKDKLLEHLSDLGHLVKVLDVDDISKINLSLSSSNALDNLAILSEMVTDTHVLHEVGSHFLNSNPDLKKLMIETTVALGRILCEVLTISSQKLHDLLEESVFLQASPVLGRMKDCPTHCLHKFANMATKITEYGPPHTWTAEDLASLGVIPAGLRPEQWKELSTTGYGNSPLAGLRPSAIRCIPPQIFKELDSGQLKSLPTLSAAAVSAEQLSHLSESQQSALARVQRVVPILKLSAGKGSSSKQNNKLKGSSASSKALNLLVIVALAVISRFST